HLHSCGLTPWHPLPFSLLFPSWRFAVRRPLEPLPDLTRKMDLSRSSPENHRLRERCWLPHQGRPLHLVGGGRGSAQLVPWHSPSLRVVRAHSGCERSNAASLRLAPRSRIRLPDGQRPSTLGTSREQEKDT